jgi:hypothetical protein
MKLQKALPLAEFAEALNTKANAQGYAEVRRELVEGLSGRVLEVGCGTRLRGSVLRRRRVRPGKQGCNWNRSPLADIQASGIVVDQVSPFQRFDTVIPAFPMLRILGHRPEA